MKICFIAENYYYNGGGERILTLLCNELIKYYDISILSLLHAENKSNYLLDKKIYIKKGNIQRLCWGGFTKFSEFKYLKANIDYLESYDVIIGLGIVPNFLLGMVSSKIKKVKLIGWEHNAYIGCSIIFKLLRVIYYRHLDLLVILTRFDLKKFRNINRNVIVINNFISIPRPQKVIAPHNNKKFVFVGRLEKQKGIGYLCKILKTYYKGSNSSWPCKIVGDGHYRNQVVNFIQRNSLEKVEILLNSSTIEQEYRNASCILLTSCFEGFPMVLLEAASVGLPIISFDCQTGPSEIVQNGLNGFLIPQYNIKLFVQKMIELQNSEAAAAESFSINAYNSSEKFLTDTIIPQWIRVLEELKR